MVPLCSPASRSAITPVFCLSHLISFCHPAPRSFFFHHPPYFFPSLFFVLFIGALHSSRHVSLLCFYPSSCRSLNPLSFALLGPSSLPVSLPALLELFPRAAPFPPTPLCFPHSPWFISSLLSFPFIPLPPFFVLHAAQSLSTNTFLSQSYTFPTIFPLASTVFPCTFLLLLLL